MDFNDFAHKAYLSAEEKGLWDDTDFRTVINLIHCEWSESLQEARSGRPILWHQCNGNGNDMDACEDENKRSCYYHTLQLESQCEFKGRKPEGIAAELADGIILICSTVKRYGCRLGFTIESLRDEIIKKYIGFGKDVPVSYLICALHELTSASCRSYVLEKSMNQVLSPLQDALGLAWVWIEMQGLDPEAILNEKYEYNNSREYKHGKLF